MIQVQVDVKGIDRTFKTLGKRAKPAMAECLTILALSARKELQETLGHYVTVRGPWSLRGMQAIRATPGKLISEVGSTRDYLVGQVSGETRDGNLAVPQVGPGKPRPQLTSRTKGRFPKDYKEKSKRRVVVLPTSKGSMGLWKEVGSKKNPGLKLLYTFADKVKIKGDRWPMYEIVARKAVAKLPEALKKAFAKFTAGL